MAKKPDRKRGRQKEERPREIEDYIKLLDNHPGTRVTQVRILGRSVTNNNVLSITEKIQTEDEDGNLRETEAYQAQLCNFGHLLRQTAQADSICQRCGRLMCSADDCAAKCSECGSACCARHRRTYQLRNGEKVTYCLSCRWLHWWRLFWGLY